MSLWTLLLLTQIEVGALTSTKKCMYLLLDRLVAAYCEHSFET